MLVDVRLSHSTKKLYVNNLKLFVGRTVERIKKTLEE